MVQVKTKNRFREGRGFSIGELQKAGGAVTKLKKMKLRVDRRRRSVHEVNVEELKKLLGELAKEKKQKPKKVKKSAIKEKTKGA